MSKDINQKISEEEILKITLSILEHSKSKHSDTFVILTALKNAVSFMQNGIDTEVNKITIQNMNNFFK